MIGKGFAGFAAALTFAMTATVAIATGPMSFGAGGAGSAASMGASGMKRLMVNPRAFRRDLADR